MKHLFLAALAAMGLSAMAQTLNVNGTLYHPGGSLSWYTASGDRIDNEKLKKKLGWKPLTDVRKAIEHVRRKEGKKAAK